MNIYRVVNKDWNHSMYDTYDSFVVIARDATQARNAHPSGDNEEWEHKYPSWMEKEEVEVQLIGTISPKRKDQFHESGKKYEIVCASYNAG